MVVDPCFGVPGPSRGIGLPGNIENGVVVSAVNPVGTEINHVTVDKFFLMDSAANTVPGFENGDFDAFLQENVCTAEPG